MNRLNDIWEQKAKKELKSEDLGSLAISLGNEISVSPIYFEDQKLESVMQDVPFPDSAPSLGEYFAVDVSENKRLLASLSQGVSFIAFRSRKGTAPWADILKDVELSWITALAETDDSSLLPQGMQARSSESNENCYLTAAFDSAVNMLSSLLLAAMKKKESAFAKMTWQLQGRDEILLSIAEHRAARAIWKWFSEKYELKAELEIETRLLIDNPDMGKCNMIAANQMLAAMSAGSDRIMLDPSSDLKESVQLKTVRNTYYLLQEEAKMKERLDPSKGSYFIENLTTTLFHAVISNS